MNGIENTAVVAAETTKSTKAQPVIVARKSLMGKWKKVGAPPKDIIGLSKNRKRGAFTKKDIFDLNAGTVSMLTITNRIKALRKANELVKMADTAKIKGAGRPPEQFNFDLSKAAPKKSRSRKVKAEVTPETPAPEVAPETPAVETTVAETQAPEAAPAVETPAVETPAA